MSHFTVMVCVASKKILPGTRLDSVGPGSIHHAVAEMLAPFYENTKDERYLAFVDEEDEMREKYATGSTERIRCADGSLVLPWDERFRVAGSWERPEAPACLERVEVPFRETYPTFEAYAKDWCGHDGPKPNGRYGHTTNPNGHWDWYKIGGRWSGFFPLVDNGLGSKARVGDIAALCEIDQKRVEATRVERRDEFLREYQALLAGKDFSSFEGPRSAAMRMGLLRVEHGPVTASPGETVLPWTRYVRGENDDRRTWNDVATTVTAETLETKYGRCFHPLVTFAAVDNDGWHAPGEMGWWACSDDSPEQYLAWCDQFVPRFLSGRPYDTLVLLDCHV